jgi:hypothetical protein
LEHFFEEWVNQFVPKSGTVLEEHRYKATGEAFWSSTPSSYFPLIIQAGYKGEVTKANPENSIKAHKQIRDRCKIILIQYLLKVKPDGSWGDLSQKALDTKMGLPTTPSSDIILKLLSKD